MSRISGNNTHTAGPWVVRHIFEVYYIVPAPHRDRPFGAATDPIADRDTYMQKIARVRGDRHGRGSAVANAELIAAAPELLAENQRLRERNAELIAALYPFCEAASELMDGLHDNTGVWVPTSNRPGGKLAGIRVGDLRRARAALGHREQGS